MEWVGVTGSSPAPFLVFPAAAIFRSKFLSFFFLEQLNRVWVGGGTPPPTPASHTAPSPSTSSATFSPKKFQTYCIYHTNFKNPIAISPLLAAFFFQISCGIMNEAPLHHGPPPVRPNGQCSPVICSLTVHDQLKHGLWQWWGVRSGTTCPTVVGRALVFLLVLFFQHTNDSLPGRSFMAGRCTAILWRTVQSRLRRGQP